MYVPQILMPALRQLEEALSVRKKILNFRLSSTTCWKICRASNRADQMPEHYSRDEHTLYLKREDLLHGGAHKTNQVSVRLYWRSGWVKPKSSPKPGRSAWRGVGPCQRPARPEMPIYMGAKDVERQSPNVFRMRLWVRKWSRCIAVPRRWKMPVRGAARLVR